MFSEELTMQDRLNIAMLEHFQEKYVNNELPQDVIETFRNAYPDLVKIWQYKKMCKYHDELKALFMKGELGEDAQDEFRNGGDGSRQMLQDWHKERDDKNSDKNPVVSE